MPAHLQNILDEKQAFLDALRYPEYADQVVPVANFIRTQWPNLVRAELVTIINREEELISISSVSSRHNSFMAGWPRVIEFQIHIYFTLDQYYSVLVTKQGDRIELKDVSFMPHEL